MKRGDAHEGQRVRVAVDGIPREGRIQQVGDDRYPGLKNAASVEFRERDLVTTWFPVACLEEVKR